MTREAAQLAPEEQFALLLDGELSLDEVTPEVRSLHALARSVEREVPVPRPTPEFRYALRRQLVSAPVQVSAWQRLRDAFWERTARWRHSARIGIASAVASSLIGTAGVAAAAQSALPGQLLYPVKEATESIRLALAGDLDATGRLHLDFARERLEEVEQGAATLSSQLLIETLEDMDRETLAGAADLLEYIRASADREALRTLTRFSQEQSQRLRALLTDLPATVVPFAETSLEVLRRVDVQLAADLAGTACDCPEGQEPVSAPVAPEDGPAGVPPRPCTCAPSEDGGDAVVPGGEDTTRPTEQPTAAPPADEDPPPDEQPSDDPVDLVPELPGPLDDVGDLVDDTLDDLLEPTPGPVQDTVDEVTDPLQDTVDEVTDPLQDTVDEVTDPLPEPTPSGTVDGLLDTPLG